MSDFQEKLDRLAEEILEESGGLDRVRRRAARHRRTRRITAGLVAVAITSTSVGLAIAAFRPSDQSRPADNFIEETPTPGPTHSAPAPDVVPLDGPTLYIDNKAGVQGLEDSVNELLQGRFAGTASSAPLEKDGRGETHILFSEGSENLALEIRDRWFTGAPLREGAEPGLSIGGPPIPSGPDGIVDKKDLEEWQERLMAGRIPSNPPDVTVVLGPDYTSYPIREGIEVHRFLVRFADKRDLGMGAEDFLSPDAANQYASHDDELQLYSYWPEDEEFGLNSLQARDGGVYEATIDVDPKDAPEPRVVILETVTIESRPGGGFWVTHAKRDP